MEELKAHKVVSALPGTLEANSVYYVRLGSGFDIYVTNDTGTIVAYQLNANLTKVTGPASATDGHVVQFDGTSGKLVKGGYTISYLLDAANFTGTLSAARLPAHTGDITSSAGSAVLTLPTVNSNVGSYGSATQVATFTVNGKGLTTAAGNVTITPAWSSVTGKPTTVAGYGITDAVTLTGGQTITGQKTFTGNTYHNRVFQYQDGVPSSNLGAPSVTEMALFNSQYNNKTWFYDPTKLSFEYTMNGTDWIDPGYNTAQKQLFLASSPTSLSGITIPNNALKYRITIRNDGNYVYLSALYMYWSGNGNSTKVHVYRKRDDDGIWVQHTNSTTAVSSWPGHLFMPFTGIAWSTASTTNHWNEVRIEFVPTSWANANPINLYFMDLWGGYPAGSREIYSWDSTKNVTFPANLTASSFIGSGASLTALNASNLSAGTLPAARLPALTGDITTTAGSAATTLATVNSNVGSFGSATAVPVITANAKGLVTSISTVTVTPAFSSITSKPTTLSGYGITDAVSSTATGLGLTGNQLSDAVTDTAAEWSALPIGYSKMMNVSIGTVGGLPSANYGYFTKIANRDTGGGWSGLWVGYGAGQNYFGRSGDSSTLPVWEKIWTEANDGTGSNLDADLLDGMNSATAATVSTIVARDSAGDITTVDLNTTAVSGNGIKFWGGNNAYSIYMSINSDTTFGGRVSGETTSDYNTYFRMEGGTNRGWVFRNASTALAGIDGSGNIRATGTITGTNLSGTNTGDQTTITGNAGTATTLQTGRTIGITGDATWTSPTFNGSSNVTAALTLASVNSNIGSYGSATQVATFTVNAKGLITAAGAVTITPAWGSITGKPTTLSGYGITDAVKTVNGASPDGSGNVTIQEVVSSAASYSYNSDGTLSGYTETISGNSKVTTLTYSSGQLSTKAVTYLGVTKTTTYTYNADGTIASTATV